MEDLYYKKIVPHIQKYHLGTITTGHAKNHIINFFLRANGPHSIQGLFEHKSHNHSSKYKKNANER
jgi:hypothetical protein